MNRLLYPILAAAALGLRPVVAAAQAAPACGCRQNLDRTVELIQTNYAGYSAKVTSATRPRLDSLTTALRQRADRTPDLLCSAVLLDWLRFFHDGHLQVRYTEGYQPAPAEIRAAFAGWERLDWTPARLRAYFDDARQPKTPVEGLWRNARGNYQLGIVATAPGEWKAVVVRADSAWWVPGQVKATLKTDAAGQLAATYYMRDHSAQPTTARLTGEGQLSLFDQWYRLYPKPVPVPAAPAVASPAASRYPSFTMLDDTTALYRIPSFDGRWGLAVDSVSKAHAAELKRTRLLIVDVRGNGGGSDQNYASLTPLLYTNPIRTVGVEHLATPENLKKYASYRTFLGRLTPAQEKSFARAMAKQQAHLGEFVNLNRRPVSVERQRRVLPAPARVAVLQDRGCGSTTEQFLLEARQSRKVTTFGDNSAGVLDYANMYFAALPCGHLQLGWATSRSLRVPRGEGIDGVGLPPSVPLAPAAPDMVEQVRTYYRRR